MNLADAFTITCGACGHVAPVDAWSRTAIGGELPLDTVQCPACGIAIRKRSPAEARVHHWPDGSFHRYYPDHPDTVPRLGSGRLIRIPTRL